ncbi:hypothetical protein LTS08_004226 [Lithohypha guttulata]|uniref:Bicarbonate transporter-like transmembrane domain-containing protein n=1 Tax=Lithohypha guttulata TaxID=1690604 RepID=A0AAN7T0B4_9EURO|nr:hypothetical protein LTR05_003634 [Lithohypha guttulata]KAK5101767.1 hypothetical protein LTS08_004226 [Lithohypha guttulata]
MSHSVAQNQPSNAAIDGAHTTMRRSASRSSSSRRPYDRRRPPFRSEKQDDPEERYQLSQQLSRQSTRRQPRWWKIRLFKGMIDDVKRRAPYYASDWTDAWDYRVIPATVYMYFANILPALAFSLDMFVKTDNSYGVNEVLLASVLGCVVFGIFACQPLVIVGVTGPITVFSYTVYDIVTPAGYNYFAFMAWKGIQVITRQTENTDGFASQYLSVTVALCVFGVAWLCGIIGGSPLLHRHVRKFVDDYGTPLTIIFFTGFVYFPHLREVSLERLPTSRAFFPTTDRPWFVNFWEVSAAEVFLALPFGFLLTILFWFDHNVSSLITQGTEFPLRKPPGFHWDIFLLGITTLVAGFLGLPFPNGLIPQAPFHTASLCVTRTEVDEQGRTQQVNDHVVEQRVSNLAQGLLFLVTMTGPLLIVLNLIPQGVLAGLFFVMGAQALAGNGVTLKIVYLFKDKELTSPTDPLKKIERQKMVWVFVAIELLGFAATFAITQTIAAIGFPVFIIALIPIRTWVMPRYFKDEELRALDAPTAGEFVMESVGGAYGETPSGEDTPRDEEEGGITNGAGSHNSHAPEIEKGS